MRIILAILFFSVNSFASFYIPNGSVTPIKRSALNIVTSSSSGVFTGTATTATAVTNLSVSITTSGRPVEICMLGDGSGSIAQWSVQLTSGTDTAVLSYLYYYRGATALSLFPISLTFGPTSVSNVLIENPGPSCYIDQPAAGTYTYSVQYRSGSSTYTTRVQFFVLTAFEL